MARVLVTGANGQMGSNLVRQLRADNHDVVGMVREGADLSGIASLDLELRKGDILDAEAVMLATEGVDVIAHLAAVYDMRARDFDAVMKPAVEGVRNVLAAAEKHDVERVIHISSTAAVGLTANPDVPRTEVDWTDDSTKQLYYRAKTESERCAWEMAEELSVPLMVLCPSMVLGRFDYRVTPSTRFIRTLVDGSGMTGGGGLNLVDVRDVATAISRAIDRGEPGDRYILGGDNLTLQEIGALVGELTGKKPMHLPAPRFAAIATVTVMEAVERLFGKDPVVTRDEAILFANRYVFVDSVKAKQVFDWQPRGAREVLEETIRWLVFTKGLKPKVLARLADKFPADRSWS
jgi:dihydroflavonol-4-reductase